MGRTRAAQRKSPAIPPHLFAPVRRAGLALPGVETSVRYDGAPMLTAEGRFMACAATHPSAEPGTLVVKFDVEEREWLLEDAPEVYYVTEHYRRHPVVLVRLRAIGEEALRDLLIASREMTLRRAGMTSGWPSGRRPAKSVKSRTRSR